jgi:hypothetical protein
MTTEIKIANPGQVVLLEMERWLLTNVGPGSMRTIKNSFMGMDDWFYTEENNLDDEDSDYEYDYDTDDDNYQEYLVFTFRREADATVFALKWTTQTV